MTCSCIITDNKKFVIARRERERGTWQSIVSRRTRSGLSVRLLTASGSPRAYALAMRSKGKLLAFLETDTEADAVVAGARGVAVALS